MNTSVKENDELIKFQTQIIQGMRDTMKRPNFRRIRIEKGK